MEIITADEAECFLEIEGGKDSTRQPSPKIRRIIVDRLNHEIGVGLTVVIPCRTVGQLRRDMLVEQARHAPLAPHALLPPSADRTGDA